MTNTSTGMVKIGVIAPGNNPQANSIYGHLASMDGVEATFVELDLPPHRPISMDATAILYGEKDLVKLDLAYVHGFTYMNPVVPRKPGLRDFSLWDGSHPEEHQRYSFVSSLLCELERRGVRMVNSLDAHIQSFAKPSFFASLAGAKLPVPEMVCTNSLEEMEQFAQDKGALVWKPPTGRGAWQLLEKKQMEHLAGEGKPPVMAAEFLDGPYIRALVYEGEPIACLHFLAPNPGPPERLETIFHNPCPEAEPVLKAFFRAKGIPWAMVHLVLHESGPVIYEVDPDPLLHWMPEAIQAPLIKVFSHKLAGREVGSDLEIPQSKVTRQSMFLKQMLWPLFEFEKRKRQ